MQTAIQIETFSWWFVFCCKENEK